MRTKSRSKAFTLVELMVVMSIIAVLAAILIPGVHIARRRAQESATISRIHTYEMAAQGFREDFGDYPPSRWSELDYVFEDADVTAVGSPSPQTVQVNGNDREAYPPSAVNEGIEVFLACVATQTGGPYIEVKEGIFGNTDYDYDVDEAGGPDNKLDVLQSTNWVFGGAEGVNHRPLFELVDYWGNPLVYVHNRDYAMMDPNPPFNGTAPSYALDGYIIKDGDDATDTDIEFLQRPVSVGLSPELNVAPNLTGFQMYSFGYDGEAGDYTDPHEEWEDNLTNWKE